MTPPETAPYELPKEADVALPGPTNILDDRFWDVTSNCRETAQKGRMPCSGPRAKISEWQLSTGQFS